MFDFSDSQFCKFLCFRDFWTLNVCYSSNSPAYLIPKFPNFTNLPELHFEQFNPSNPDRSLSFLESPHCGKLSPEEAKTIFAKRVEAIVPYKARLFPQNAQATPHFLFFLFSFTRLRQSRVLANRWNSQNSFITLVSLRRRQVHG